MEENNISQEIKATMAELKKLIENSNSLNVSMANRKQSLAQSVEDALNEGRNTYNQNTGRLNSYSPEFEEELRSKYSPEKDFAYSEMLKNHIEIENNIKAYVDRINEESKLVEEKLQSLNSELAAEKVKVISQFHADNPYVDNTYMPDNQARIEELESQISKLEDDKSQLAAFKQEFYSYFYTENEISKDSEIPVNYAETENIPKTDETKANEPKENNIQMPADFQKSHEDEIRALTDKEYSERRRAQAEHIINNLKGNNEKTGKGDSTSKGTPAPSQPATKTSTNPTKSNASEINVPDFVDLHPDKLYTISARDGKVIINGSSVKVDKKIKEYEINDDKNVNFDNLARTTDGNKETIFSKDNFEELLKGNREDYEDLDFNVINSLVNYYKGIDAEKDTETLRNDLKNAIEDYKSTIRENSGKIHVNYDLKSMKSLKKNNKEAYNEIAKHAHQAYTNKTKNVDIKAPWYTKLGWKIVDTFSLNNTKALNPGTTTEEVAKTESSEKHAEESQSVDPSKPAPSPMRESVQVSPEKLNQEPSAPVNPAKQNQKQNEGREER